ncbi:mediator complex, subunit Med18 [Pyronema omphalodes]|nr:mediator complex, subunit Med18 [Pyronema omphalodes]
MQNFPQSHHELSLYAYISASRQPQVLKMLSGVAGMRNEPFVQHHLLYKPARPRTPGAPTDHFYMQLICRIAPDETKESYNPREQRWCMRLEDLPEVTRKPVISRGIYSANTYMGDALEFMEALGYTLQSSYFTDNNRFIHGNIIITVSQTSIPPRAPLAPTAPGAPTTGESNIDPFGSPFPKERLQKVDDGWVLQAAVRVQSNTDVQSVNAGVQELLYLKKALEGVCELDVVERLALDTRVR